MGNDIRHAIYFAPPKGSALAGFGAGWLGRDAETGRRCGGKEIDGLPAPREELTAEAARYGFHATLKAPFRLAEGTDEAALDEATERVAARSERFTLDLEVSTLGSFLALVPREVPPALRALERACVVELDRFRARLSPAEVERRRSKGLDSVEGANLARWGYPYVLERFRFHMTLAGPLPEAIREEARAALRNALPPILAAPVAIAEICRFSEAADGQFRIVRRFPLGREARDARVPRGALSRP